MIVRKPYAFLLTHFKLIHLLLAGLMSYVIYKTWGITNFFSDYFSEGENVVGQELTDGLFSVLIYVAIVGIIIGIGIVLFLMFTKKKPVKYYGVTLLIYSVSFIFMNICENLISRMEGEQLDTRTLKAFSDITLILLIVEVISFLPAFIRGIGFNVQQFDFEKDLQELDITEEDREEVEIGFGIDVDKFKRSFNRNIRHIRYAYLENKLIANGMIAIVALFLGYTTYSALGLNEKVYRQGQYFNTTNFNMSIQDSYIINSDYKGKSLGEGVTLLVLRMKIRNLYNTPIVFYTTRAELNIEGHKYYPIKDYTSAITDFGTLYNGDKITTNETTYVLCYRIPNNYLDKEIQFHYVDSINNFTEKVQTTYEKIVLKPVDLRLQAKELNYKIGDEMDVKSSFLGESKVTFTSYDVKDEYTINYNFCPKVGKGGQCQYSKEYLKPSIETNYDKTLMKLTYKYDTSGNLNNRYKNLFNVIADYGKLEYEIDGKMKEHSINLVQVKPQKASLANTLYIEVLSELEKASKVYLKFNIRNQNYAYQLK